MLEVEMIPIDEQINHQQNTVKIIEDFDDKESLPKEQAILASLQRLKAIEKMGLATLLKAAEAELDHAVILCKEVSAKLIELVEAAEKVSANVVDGQSMRVSIEDLIALKNTLAALNKERSCS
jgi:hypothetical protein